MKISIINYKTVLEYPHMRYDAEFFQPEYLKAINSIKKKGYILNSDCSIIKSGVTPQDRDDESVSDVILLKTNNIRNNFQLRDNIDGYCFIEKKVNEIMRATEINPYDVLINIVGATLDVIGRTSFIFDDFPKSNITQAIAFCRVKDNQVHGAYLFTFLSSYYGKVQVCKFARSTGQYNLNLDELSNFLIYLPTFDFQKIISNLVSQSYNLIKSSSVFFNESKKILFSELGLTNWKPKHQLSFVRKFSETEEAGRMDAEYFHPSYDQIVEAIEKTGQVCSIKDLLSVCQRGNQPVYCDEGSVVINSKHVKNGEISFDDDNRKGEVSNASILIQKNDILMNGTGVGTIGRCSPYLHDHPAIPDNHVTVLRTKKMDSVFLAIQLDSIVGQMQVKKFQKGSSGQIELYPDDIKNFIVWNAPVAIQEEIRQKISESFTLRRQSKHLLECAKLAVEIAIEQDEQTAIEWLERETE